MTIRSDKMILINGKEIENKNSSQEQTIKKPSINEILQKMQTNYDNQIYATKQQSTQPNSDAQPQTTSNTENQNNLLLSVLPALLKQKQTPTVQTQDVDQNEILKTLLKNLNNPMLEKLFELLPLFSKKTKAQQADIGNKKSETKIDSLVKTDDYHSNN